MEFKEDWSIYSPKIAMQKGGYGLVTLKKTTENKNYFIDVVLETESVSELYYTGMSLSFSDFRSAFDMFALLLEQVNEQQKSCDNLYVIAERIRVLKSSLVYKN